MFTFFQTWLIYSSSYHLDNAFPLEPTWLFLGFLGVGLDFLGQKIEKKSDSTPHFLCNGYFFGN